MARVISIGILLLPMILASAPHALAQSTIRGVVSDSVTNEPLVGANVYLAGTAIGVVTDREGTFRIARVPQGSFNLRISYLGYVPREIGIDMGSDTTLVVHTRLIPEVLEGEEVVVTGQARGQIAAINQQISSKTIVNVVSEEKIQELPDVNAAESIGRLPGVSILRSGGEANRVVLRGLSGKYTSVTLDGMRISSTDPNSRDLDLNTISQTSLAGIELYKALTPDRDADAIAGSVNLVTRKAPSERLLKLDARGIYNELMNVYDQYDFSMRYGERFFDDLLGVQLSGNLERRNRSNERYNVDWDRLTQSNYYISNFLVEFTDEIRKRNGFGVLLDVNTPDSGSIRVNNSFSRTDRSYLLSTRNYPVGSGISLTYSARDIEQEIGTFNSSVRGENYLSGMDITWGASFGQSDAETPYDYFVDFIEPSILDSNDVPISGMRQPVPPDLKNHPELLIPYALNNYSVAYINNAYFRTERNSEKERAVFLDVATRYGIGDLASAEIKIGGKYKHRDRFKERTERYSPYYLGYWRENTRLLDGTIVPKNFAGTWFNPFFERFIQTGGAARNAFAQDFLDPNPGRRDLFGIYTLSPIVNRDALRLWYELNRNGVSGLGPEYYDNSAVSADYYDIVERVSSAYVMNTIDFGRDVTLIAGVRVEREQNSYHSRYAPRGISGFPIPAGLVSDTSNTYSETVWLPNFHLNVRPTDFMNLRLAAYRALARPDFNLRLIRAVPLGGVSAGSGNLALILGNPGLRTAKAWNYEVNTSFYGNTFGLISVSGFYKVIDDISHQLNGAGTVGNRLIDTLGVTYPNPPVGAYLLTMPYNSFKPTKVWGFEFEHQMNFTFLPGLLKNIVLSYNASIIRSETFIVGTDTVTTMDSVFVPGFGWILAPFTDNETVEKKQKLEGQPEFYGNISLGYDIGGFSARVSLFYQAEHNFLFSSDGQSDQVIDAFARLDLMLKYQVSESLALMLNINNFTNTEESNSILNRAFDRKLVNTSEKYGLTADLGVRFTL